LFPASAMCLKRDSLLTYNSLSSNNSFVQRPTYIDFTLHLLIVSSRTK
jgi:hypothetical protein